MKKARISQVSKEGAHHQHNHIFKHLIANTLLLENTCLKPGCHDLRSCSRPGAGATGTTGTTGTGGTSGRRADAAASLRLAGRPSM
jgi:hypothetical protein